MGGPQMPRVVTPTDTGHGPRRERIGRRLAAQIAGRSGTRQVECLKAVVASINRGFSAATVRPSADLLFIADRAPLPLRELAPPSIWASTLIISEPVNRET
jgi:hypothetical protein